MKRLVYTAIMLLAAGFFYAGTAAAAQPFAGCPGGHCVTTAGCNIACNACEGDLGNKNCTGITQD